MSDLKDILKNEDELNQEQLLRYLAGSATEEERFAIEKQMADSAFIDDAVEGLQQFEDPEKARLYAEQLDRQLKKYTAVRESRRRKRRLKDQHWVLIAIFVILLLCIAGYLLVHFTNTFQ